MIRLVYTLKPTLKNVSLRNLQRAFPDSSHEWHLEIVRKSQESLSRLIVDILRFHRISDQGVKQIVNFPDEEKFFELMQSGRPVIIAAGHLGNFELFARAMAANGSALGVVAREFKPAGLNSWWTLQRESCGNTVIPREGALRTTLKFLKAAKPVGILYDQNITRQFADFVDWFGYPAATSKLIPLLAIRNRAQVIVTSIKYEGSGKYTAVYKVKDFEELYNDEALSVDRKCWLMTAELSADYVEMIRDNPGEWFWMHKRWKTAPEGQPEDFYKNL